MERNSKLWFVVLFVAAAFMGCGSTDTATADGGAGFAGQAGSAGSAGTSGSAGIGGAGGSAGSSGTGGSAGQAGTSGSAGSAGTAGTGGFGGSAGTAGAGGQGGSSGIGGAAGSAGSSGTGGSAGTAGSSGSAGTSGSGGAAGSAGSSGTGGQAGTAGTGGAGGEAGNAGSAGSAGTGGAGGSAGHDFGNCSPLTANNTPYTCSTWTQVQTPSTTRAYTAGCANSATDQWAVGDNGIQISVNHFTGTVWQEVALPTEIPGDPSLGNPDVFCLGTNQVFVIYNSAYEGTGGGIFLHWNGSGWDWLQKTQLNQIFIQAMWGTSANDIWFWGYNWADPRDYFLMRWNGSTLTMSSLPLYSSRAFWGFKMWGSDDSNVYLVGKEYDYNDQGNPNKEHGAIIHWDGSSWAKIVVPQQVQAFLSIHGSSSCDVMAVGYDRAQISGGDNLGATFQRNGNDWMHQSYSSLHIIASLFKVAPQQYVAQGSQSVGVTDQNWMGEDTGDFTISWSHQFSFFSSGSEYDRPGAIFEVPGTSPKQFVSLGDGIHTNGDPSGSGSYGMAFTATCQ